MLFKKLVRILRDIPEGGGGGGGTPTPREPETFSREYVHELREENKAQRLKALENEQKAQAAEAAAAKAKEEADVAIAKAKEEASKATNDRVIRAELKALATANGIKNIEYLKLADVSAITLDADGNVVGADKLIEQMKKDMPDLFVTTTTTTTTTTLPKADDPKTKKATEMTAEEYAEARKELLKKKR